jgi:hypothetical protein
VTVKIEGLRIGRFGDRHGARRAHVSRLESHDYNPLSVAIGDSEEMQKAIG